MTGPCPILGGRELSSCGAARGGLSSAFVLRGVLRPRWVGSQVGPGAPVIDRWFRQNHCRVDPATWVPRRLRRGSPTFFEESRGKEHQGQAPGPHFLWPLVPTRWFLGSLSPMRSRDDFVRYPNTDLGRIFPEKYGEKAFCERKSPNQGTYMGLVIAYRPGQCGTQRQNERVATSGPSKRGGGGPPPATLCVRAFSRESLDPPPGTGRETTPQVWTCDGPSLNHLPRGHPPRFSPQVMVR